MPSASAAKLEKQASTEAVEPIKQAVVIIEHKIRNLEKRKRKIESYRDEQKNGKELNADQLNAVSKYDEVLQTLAFARDLCNQFNAIAVDAAKQQKKQARKEALERAQQDCLKVKKILCIQDVLQNIGTESAREDFLAGRNGAHSLTDDDLKYLDDIYHEVFPRRGHEEGLASFEDQLTSAAEHLQCLVEGKSKEVVGTTYKHIKETIEAIHNCGYFDQNLEENADEVAPEVIDNLVAPSEPTSGTTMPPVGDEIVEEDDQFIVESQTVLPSDTQHICPGPTVPAVSTPQQAQPVPPSAVPPQTPQTPQVTSASAPATSPTAQPSLVQAQPMASVPTPVAGVESSFFSTSAPAFVPSQPTLPQTRALNDVISSVTGSFNFLQDSELDSPDLAGMLAGTQSTSAASPPPTTPVAVAPIPTQTFTNQNFASTSVQQKVQPSGQSPPHQHHHQQQQQHSQQAAAAAQPSPPQQTPQPAGPSTQNQSAQQPLPQSVAQSASQPPLSQSPAQQAVQAQQIQASVGQSQGQVQVPSAVSAVQPLTAQAGTGQVATQPSQNMQSTSYAQKVDMSQSTDGSMSVAATVDEPIEEWSGAEAVQSDWNQQNEANASDWSQQANEDWGNSNQNDGYTTQGSNRNYSRNRANSRGRGGSNGYVGRGRGNYQNGRGSNGGGGGGSGGYGYRNDGSSNNYFQNGYPRDNYGGYKRGRGARGAAPNAPRGMDRGGMRGMGRAANRGVRPSYPRGANKQQQ